MKKRSCGEMRRLPLLISNQGMWNQHSVPNSFVPLIWEFPLKCKIKAVSSTSTTLLMQKSLIAESLWTLPAQNKRASKNWLHKASSLGFWLFFPGCLVMQWSPFASWFQPSMLEPKKHYFWWSFCWPAPWMVSLHFGFFKLGRWFLITHFLPKFTDLYQASST